MTFPLTRKLKHDSVKHLLPVLLILFCLALEIAGQPAKNIFQYQREAVLSGELWRLVSAHAVHLGWGHTLMNTLGLAVVWILFNGYLKPWLWLLAIFWLSLSTSLGLLVFSHDVHWYVGLSGVLHGLIVIGLAGEWPRKQASTYLLASVLAGKLVYEGMVGSVPGTDLMSGGEVVTAAHLYGSLGGLLFAGGVALAYKGFPSDRVGPTS